MISESPPETGMPAEPDAEPDALPDAARGDERLVREAILLVACHAAPRVLVAGITYGELVLERLRRPALEAGVRLRGRPTADDARVDVIVEAIR